MTTQPIEIKSTEAYQRLQSENNALLVDVRASMEYLFVGYPKGSINIPWIDAPEWEVNPSFVKEIRQLLHGESCGNEQEQPSVFLICRSGKRSLEAGKHLIDANISNVYNISDGFEGERDEKSQRSTINGWRFEGLPWEQS